MRVLLTTNIVNIGRFLKFSGRIDILRSFDRRKGLLPVPGRCPNFPVEYGYVLGSIVIRTGTLPLGNLYFLTISMLFGFEVGLAFPSTLSRKKMFSFRSMRKYILNDK